jgi:uncharacterized protein YjiS (DUF1127 family)
VAHKPIHIVRWFRQRQTRNMLLKLDDRMLRDIGVSRAEIDAHVNGTWQR